MSWEAWGSPDDIRCEVCGNVDIDCVCPECPICGAVGDPRCYNNHGLERSEEQIQASIRNDPNNDP